MIKIEVVRRGALLLVMQWQCISSYVFYIFIDSIFISFVKAYSGLCVVIPYLPTTTAFAPIFSS